MKIYRVEIQNTKTLTIQLEKFFSSMEKAIEYTSRFQIEYDGRWVKEGQVYSLQSDIDLCTKNDITFRPRFIIVDELDAA
jgi:hypothetical protein